MDRIRGETKEVEVEKAEDEEEGYEGYEGEEEAVGGVYNIGSLYNKSPSEIKINKEAINRMKMLKMMKRNEAKVSNYFKDKSKYEKKIHDLKNKIRAKNSLSTRDKRREFKNSIKCIKCNKKGGTLFSNENNVLKEVCNAAEPCSLNVELKRRVVDNLIDLERMYTTMLNDVKKQIVIANMDLLFKYKTSSETAELFEKTLKDALEKSKEELRVYSDLVSSIINRNKDAIYEKTNMLKDEINGLNTDGLLDVEGGGGVSKVNKYITNVLPILKELRGVKYSYSGTECESSLNETPCSGAKDNIYVIQIPFTIKDMEVDAKK